MRIDVTRLARRVLVLVVVSGLPALAITAPSGRPSAANVASHASSSGFEGIRLTNVASRVGLDLRQGAFRFGVSPDPAAMTGGGLCALDYNNDGWVDLFVVNSYSEADAGHWRKHGGLPRTALFRNTKGRFTDVSRPSKADLAVRGEACVAADPNVPVPGSAAGFPNNVSGVRDLLYLNVGRDRNGHSKFREVGVQAGLEAARFDHSLGAVFSDFDGDGRLDLYVANDGNPNRLYQNVAWP